ncbi:unnamed protein product [Peniophora sp. CBMAI 1063]|nr:unnamed protein product [Peniophora sp. CBMAI 1063]
MTSVDQGKLSSLVDMNPDINFAFGLLNEILSRITFSHLCNVISVVVSCFTLYVLIQVRNAVRRLEAEATITRAVERRTDIRIGIETLGAIREIVESLRGAQNRPRTRQEAGMEPPRAREVEAGAHEEGRASVEGAIVRSESTREEKVAKALQDLTQKQWGEFEPEEADW